ncbi:uncharacterized protein H6S33_006186 [Morchella sextelata]|uniref:uncharacterized protein n=1 Tax=Morchella sextelata TaxID=1174677 RepID=UPI001D03E9C9|nr:uncharacterized protein H6S33_006186 [Morchella sextelata]KAH0614300.1 hypothetical protein H6S33_006186 [Morchella sextelata]
MATPLNNTTDDLNTNPRSHLTTNITAADDHAIPKQFCPLDVTKASLHALQEGVWVLATTAFELISAHAFQDDPISSSSSSSSSQASEAPDDINLEPKESRAIIVALLDQAVSTPLPRNVPRPRMKCSTCKNTKWNCSLVIDEEDPGGDEESCTSDYDSEYEDEGEEEEEKDGVTNQTIDMVHFCPTLPVQVWNGERFVERPCTHGLEVIEG